METSGTLALVGGDEWTEGCTFDASLLAASGGTDVMVLPTRRRLSTPGADRAAGGQWFEPLGAQVEGLMVVDRASSEDPGMAATLAGTASSTSPGARRFTCGPCSRGRPSTTRSCGPSPAVPSWPGPGPGRWSSRTPWPTPAAVR